MTYLCAQLFQLNIPWVSTHNVELKPGSLVACPLTSCANDTGLDAYVCPSNTKEKDYLSLPQYCGLCVGMQIVFSG